MLPIIFCWKFKLPTIHCLVNYTLSTVEVSTAEHRQPAATMDTTATSQNRPTSSPPTTEAQEQISTSRFVLSLYTPSPLFCRAPLYQNIFLRHCGILRGGNDGVWHLHSIMYNVHVHVPSPLYHAMPLLQNQHTNTSHAVIIGVSHLMMRDPPNSQWPPPLRLCLLHLTPCCPGSLAPTDPARTALHLEQSVEYQEG